MEQRLSTDIALILRMLKQQNTLSEASTSVPHSHSNTQTIPDVTINMSDEETRI